MVHGSDPEHAKIVAYIVYKPGQSATGSELRRFLRNSLPDYMLPHLFVELEAIPLTANGKVDRQALPPPLEERRSQDEGFIAPRTPTEQALAALWKELLKIELVSVRDNFFELGGHSLLSAQMVVKAGQQGYRLQPRSVIFETLGAARGRLRTRRRRGAFENVLGSTRGAAPRERNVRPETISGGPAALSRCHCIRSLSLSMHRPDR